VGSGRVLGKLAVDFGAGKLYSMYRQNSFFPRNVPASSGIVHGFRIDYGGIHVFPFVLFLSAVSTLNSVSLAAKNVFLRRKEAWERKMNDKIFKAGELCPQSGQYAIVDDLGKMTGSERTVVQHKPFPPTPKKNHGYLLVDATQFSEKKPKYTNHVTGIVIYYLIVLFFSFWFLLDTWGSQFTLMRWIGLRDEALVDPLLRTIGFTLVGGILGSVLYHMRVLFHYFAQKKNYDPDWLGKYITAPWEGAGMALVVLSLIRGGVAVFGGSMGTDVTGANNFAAFGTGALVGFGMRDVVGWIGNLIYTMFRIEKSSKLSSLTESSLKKQEDEDKKRE